MDEVLSFVDDYSKRLARPIRDLQDVRESMNALADIRNNQIHLDMSLGPIEVNIEKILVLVLYPATQSGEVLYDNL